MKVWITKYALERGIIEATADRYREGVLVDWGVGSYYAPGDWYSTPEAAAARARTMRDLEVTKLRRQIERLETLVFEVGT